MFSGDVSNASTYWNSTNATNDSSAKSYIPEQPWNETTASGGLDAGGSGGGGASGFFSKPAWQTGLGVPNDSSRDLPDISLNAAAQHDGYLVCSQGSCTNGFLASNGQANVFGGTSFVAPTFAGILALWNRSLAPERLGNIGPMLYGLPARGSHELRHHLPDIIQTGNNSVPCSQGTPNCPNGGSIGYTARITGYDQATGLGSLDVSKLVNGWASATPTGTGSTIGAGLTTTTLTTTSQLCAVSAATLPLTVTVAGSITGTTPTGTIQFFVDNKAVGHAPGSAQRRCDPHLRAQHGHDILWRPYHQRRLLRRRQLRRIKGHASRRRFDTFRLGRLRLRYPEGLLASHPALDSVTVASGATSGGVTFTITPVHGFTGTVTLTAVNNNLGAFTPSFSVTPVNITSATGVTTSFVVKASQTTAQLTPTRPYSLPASSIRQGSLVRRWVRRHSGLHASPYTPTPPSLGRRYSQLSSPWRPSRLSAAVETPRRTGGSGGGTGTGHDQRQIRYLYLHHHCRLRDFGS